MPYEEVYLQRMEEENQEGCDKPKSKKSS